ncbi:MAG TPA: response regulator [Polyangiaceae bacterium]|nr:response regulator [Polyangiaceae bacterium]
MPRTDLDRAPYSEVRPSMPRLLVVDDELLLLEALEVALVGQVEVLATVDPYEALARIDTGERFDAILLDVKMPEMDGLELYERIAAISPAQARRIVFMTAATIASRPRSENAILRKPVDLSRIDELLWPPERCGRSRTQSS